MAGRLPILQSLSLLLPNQNGSAKGTVQNGLQKPSPVKTCTNGAQKISSGERTKGIKNGFCKGLSKATGNNLNPQTDKLSKGRKKRKRKPVRSRKKAVEQNEDLDKQDNSTPPTSPSKLRLSSLIDRLSKRTSQPNHDNKARSPTKRTRHDSLIIEEPAVKKAKTDEVAEPSGSLEPDCSIELVDSVDLSDSHRSMTLAVAKILNLEKEISLLKRRFTTNKIPINDRTVRVYTGLPNEEIFNAVYERIKPMVLKIRCRKQRRAEYSIRRKYRRIQKLNCGFRRLNLRDEFMLAMSHAKNDYDLRDTARRYALSLGQCRSIVSFWASFLPHELQKALMSLGHILPKSKWSHVPEYVPSPERDSTPCSESSSESADSDSSTSTSTDLKTEKTSLSLKLPDRMAKPLKTDDNKELRKLISHSKPTEDHEGFFDLKSSYICQFCFSFHDSSLDLLEHTRSRFGLEYDSLHSQLETVDKGKTKMQKWTCSLCNESRKTLSSFLSHVNLHIHQPPSRCVLCDRLFTSKELLEQHVHKQHAKQPSKKRTFFCKICCIVFSNAEQFDQHQVKHSKGKTVPSVGGPYFEHKNPKIAIPRLQPVKTVPKQKNTAETTDSPKKVVIPNPPKTVVGRRALLPKPLITKEKVIRNLEMKCDQCEIVVTHITDLEKHKRTEHGEKPSDDRLKCPYCPRTFAHRVTRKVHMTNHTGEKPHKCRYCEKSFFRKNDLYNHERIHTGVKPYACQFCGAKFAHSCSLAAHVRQSCIKVPSKCEICGFKCEQRSEFQTHMKTHVGEGKYRCNICGKTFLMRHHLEQHKNIHLKRFPCNSCNDLFHSLQELEIHSKVHSDPPARGQHGCEMCTKSFTRRSDLKRHKRRIHHIFESAPLKTGSVKEEDLGIDPLILVE